MKASSAPRLGLAGDSEQTLDKPAVVRYAESEIPTTRGPVRVVVYREVQTSVEAALDPRAEVREHVALVYGRPLATPAEVLVRVHSECITSEVFGSTKCDCREQLHAAMERLQGHEPGGVILYLRQEGRGIGLGNKIRAYALQQEHGLDTVQANLELGFADDLRRYDVAAEMLRSLGVQSVDLITNNPLKIAGLVDEGIPVRRRIPSRTQSNPLNVNYLKTKRDRSGHLIEFLPEEASEAKAG